MSDAGNDSGGADPERHGGELRGGRAALPPGAPSAGALSKRARRRRKRKPTKPEAATPRAEPVIARAPSHRPAPRRRPAPGRAGVLPRTDGADRVPPEPPRFPPPRTGVRPGTHAIGERAVSRAEHAAPRIGRRPASGAGVYAALDLGTNNCRLLVAEPQERGFRVVNAFSRIVRLGEGISQSGRLGEAAMTRAVEALAVCRDKLAEYEVNRMRLVATEACRTAANGPEFLARVRHETGLELEIVDRETEARLAVAGCAALIDRNARGVLLFDIGGGSSELVWLDLRKRGHSRGFGLTRFIRSWISLPVGVVTVSERYGGTEVTPELFEAMVAEVAALLDGLGGMEDFHAIAEGGDVHMLGTSGTVTTLAGIHLGLKRYDRRKVDGTWLAGLEVEGMIARLAAMTYEERVANPCIGAERADLVLAGCAILEAICRRWPCERLRVADRGLREGILVEMMARDGVWRRPRPQGAQPGARPGGAGRRG